jgi:CspA family cold shock protein
MNGMVARVIQDKGFGFITDSDGAERFFHSSQVTNVQWHLLKGGEAVTFDPDKGPKGLRALNVQVALKGQ